MKPQKGRYRLPYDVTERHVKMIEEVSKRTGQSKAQVLRNAIEEHHYSYVVHEIANKRG